MGMPKSSPPYHYKPNLGRLLQMKCHICNKELSKKCAEIAYYFENSVVEIEKLKTIIEEAIRKPMGVEPHSWSDYKMQKDNTWVSNKNTTSLISY